ncbi:MAG: 3,4-dihydroxyphenylacetate 2,3-dioxygenase [Rhodospirillum sp.]|nr:3,4-dihydroxyphenylacetate 2,3-dioxygenase [Rhodospirillum sp.]MCF8500576.1 3,4-dihydroxyphenylacetate 2,3-dioxygenase [Rhodospirillum sp.]
MGKLALAAKITHVPSMYLSELPGKHQGCREAAIQGHKVIGQRCRDLGVDTIVVFDTHWLVNGGYHINCGPHFKGVYTSNELPHFIKDMAFDYDGDPVLGRAIAEAANKRDKINCRAHEVASLELEYGTLVPMRYMNQDRRFKVISIAAWCAWHFLDRSMALGAAVREAIEASDRTVAVFASGSLSHRFSDDGSPEEAMDQITDEFFHQVDQRVVDLWKDGCWTEFLKMLPSFARLCHGEGGMHDTAMLLGLLGGAAYTGKAEIITDYFPSSGTGQINACFPV